MGLGLSKYFPWKNNRNPSGQIATAQEVSRIYNVLLHRDPDGGLETTSESSLDLALSVARSEEYLAAVRAAENLDDDAPSLVLSGSRYGGLWLTDRRDTVIGECLRRYGGFEEADVGAAVGCLAELGRPVAGPAFLDIGGNIGTHSVYALKHGFETAYCFEPDPSNFALMRINQILHGVDGACHNYCMAMSDEDGSADLELSSVNFGDHRISMDTGAAAEDEAPDLYNEKNRTRQKIQVSTLDSWAKTSGLDLRQVGLAWIDTQGHEGQILQGAGSLLRSGVPIVAEFWPYGLSRSGGYRQLRSALEHSGAQIRVLRDRADGENRAPITLEALDALYEEYLAGERPEYAVHSDLLIYCD